MSKFKLSEKFVEKYKRVKPPFGYNGLGELVYRRTYSRIKENCRNEEWWETIERVVNGTYNMQKNWVDKCGLGWNAWRAQSSAQEMYDRMFNMKFLPPGRGLWAMGTELTEERGIFASLNNCSFVSTAHIKDDPSMPFCFLMDMSMLGVGVGFDTRGATVVEVKGPNRKRSTETYQIPDDREGWVESLRLLLDSYFLRTAPVEFDYGLIRKAGKPIKGFGGTASGPGPLKTLHKEVTTCLDSEAGQPISITAIVDIMNMIGKCVVAGNVRRTAEVVFGDPYSEEYLDLKDYKKNPQRKGHGWTSNNSIFAELGMQYGDVAERTKNNGEPGYIWLENIQRYGRMYDKANNKDHRAQGTNPCAEQPLEHAELCCLVESFPDKHVDFDDYARTLKYAYLYAKTVTLGKTHWADTNRVLLRNRRIGCSVSGVAQFIAHHGQHKLKCWLKRGYDLIQEYDKEYSDWLAIPRSIKTTSVKPSGTVSLLVGSTPGMHFPESRYYIRRIRIAKNSDLIGPLTKAGYKLEASADDPEHTMVVEVPVDVGEGVRLLPDTTMWEQFSLAAFMQRYWADNAVSCTVTFNPETEGDQIKYALDYFQYQLKGISLLPRKPAGAYPQMPYEAIDEETYKERSGSLKKLQFRGIKGEEADIERFCDGDACELPRKKGK